jgi:hypothetical protein
MTPNTLYVGVGWARAAWQQAHINTNRAPQFVRLLPRLDGFCVNPYCTDCEYYRILDAATLALERGSC